MNKKEMAQKMMSKEKSNKGFGFHSAPKYMSVNLNPKRKHKYSKGEQAYIKASQKGKASLKSTGKNEGEHMMIDKKGNQRA